MKKLVLAVGVGALLFGYGTAMADNCAPKRHHHVSTKLHMQHAARGSHSPYPVYSYSVPRFGAYSGYAYYDVFYPSYLPKWPRDAENNPPDRSTADNDLLFQYDGNANRNELLRN